MSETLNKEAKMNDEVKKLNLDEFRNIFVENATVAWLTKNGLDPSDPNTNSVELDEDNESSQLSAWKATAHEAFEFFLETLHSITEKGYELNFGDEDSEPKPEPYPEDYASEIREWLDDQLGNGGKSFAGRDIPKLPENNGAVYSSSAIFVFLETAPGVAKTVGDVREWLARVDSFGIPDSQEVDGSLHLDYDMDVVSGEKSECLYCGNNDDMLMVLHECTAGEEDVDPEQPSLF